jgi:hypothetical protein
MTGLAMSAEALLASLMAQAEGRGVDMITLRALVEESSQAGARRALASLGLDDERARRDMDELRELLSAWRDAKRSAWRAVVSWAVRLMLALLLIGIAVRPAGRPSMRRLVQRSIRCSAPSGCTGSSRPKKCRLFKRFRRDKRGTAAFWQQRASFPTLRGNRPSHNVFRRFNLRTHVKGDKYAQAGHCGGARIDGLGDPGCRSGSLILRRP